MLRITNFSQQVLEKIPNTALSPLLQHYASEYIREIFSDDGIESGKLTLEEAIDRFKYLEDTTYPLEGDETTQFLSTKYILPDWIDENFMWKFRGSDKFLEEWDLFDKIVELNPQLKEIVIRDERDKQEIFNGIASRFPVEDIKYWVEILDCWRKNERFSNALLSERIRNDKNLYEQLEFYGEQMHQQIKWHADMLRIALPDVIYKKLNDFSSYESYIQYIEDAKIRMKLTGKFDEWEKEFSQALWDFDITDEKIFAYFYERDHLSILNYPIFAYILYRQNIKDLVCDEKWIGFWSLLSPESLEKFIQHHHIQLFK